MPISKRTLQNEADREKPPARRRIRIRPATEVDLSPAQQLECATFTAHAISPRQMRYLMKSPHATFLVAMKGDQLVGDGIALFRRQRGGTVGGRIYSVVVDPNHRGEKIGEKLMAALIDALALHRVGQVSLEVDQSNAGAIRLYERLGFKTVRTLHHFYGHKKHGIRMTLDLGVKDPPST